MAQQWSKKKLKPKDIFSLPWDRENDISEDFVQKYQQNHLEDLTKFINNH